MLNSYSILGNISLATYVMRIKLICMHDFDTNDMNVKSPKNSVIFVFIFVFVFQERSSINTITHLQKRQYLQKSNSYSLTINVTLIKSVIPQSIFSISPYHITS